MKTRFPFSIYQNSTPLD